MSGSAPMAPLRAHSVAAGVIDGVAFFVGVIALAVLPDQDPAARLASVFGVHWRFAAFGLVPASIVVAWRGWADAVRIVSGRGSWLRLPAEGGLAGTGVIVVFFIIGAVDAAWAAGGAFDGIRSWGIGDWVSALRSHGEIAVHLGASGFAGGGVLTALNRLVVRVPISGASSTPTPSG